MSTDTIAACVIDLDLGLGAGAMVIQKRIQMLPIETSEHGVVFGFCHDVLAGRPVMSLSA